MSKAQEVFCPINISLTEVTFTKATPLEHLMPETGIDYTHLPVVKERKDFTWKCPIQILVSSGLLANIDAQ